MCRHLAYLGPPVTLRRAARRPAARAVPAVLGAAAPAARHRERGRVRRRLVRRRRPGARPLPPGRADLGRPAASPTWPGSTRTGAVLAAVRSATDGHGARRGGRRPVRRRALAVQPQRRARPAGPRDRRPRREPARRGSARRWRRACDSALLLGAGGDRLRAGAPPGRRAGRRGRRRVGRARHHRPVQLPAHRRRGDRRHRRRRHPVLPRAAAPAAQEWWWRPSPATTGPDGRTCPTDSVLTATLDGVDVRPLPVMPPPPAAGTDEGRIPDLMTALHVDTLPARRATSTAPCAPTSAAGLTGHAQDPAAQVVLRRARQRALRGDHPAARVLPDPRRAGDPGRPRRARSPPPPAPAPWSSWARAPRTRPGCCSTRCARPARCAATSRWTSARPRCRGGRRRCSADYPGLAVTGRRRRLRGASGPARRRRRRGWSPSSAAPSATCCPAQRAAFLASVRARLGARRRLLLGTDLVKDPEVLVAAYDDAAGRHRRVQQERPGGAQPRARRRLRPRRLRPRRGLGRRTGVDRDAAALAPSADRHAARDRTSTVPFAEGEEMRTEMSAKFRPDGVRAELSAAGFTMQHWWTDTGAQFGLSLSIPT